MDYLWLFTASFAVALSGALAPGPLLAVTIDQSLRRGYRAGPLLIAGHALAEAMVILLLVFGLGRALHTPQALKSVALVGAAVLIILGVSSLAGLRRLKRATETPSPFSGANLPLLGMIMSLSNPYWTVWWLTAGLGLVMAAQKTGLAGISVFFAGHISADLLWYSLVSALVCKNKRFISLKTYRVMVGCCAAALIAFGLYFGISWL